MRNGFAVLITFQKEGTLFEYVFKVDPDNYFLVEDLGLRDRAYEHYDSPIVAVEMSSEAFDWFVMHPPTHPVELLPDFDFGIIIPNLFRDDDRTNVAMFRFDSHSQQPDLIGIIADSDKDWDIVQHLTTREVPRLMFSPFMSLESAEDL